MKYLLFCIFFVFCFSQELETYNIIPNSLTLSGLSSGGYFAVQFQVAYSSMIEGAAILAGGPYACSELNMNRALTACMSFPTSINVNSLVTAAKRYEAERKIDSLSNLAKHKAYIFHGTLDSVVRQPTSDKLRQFYESFGLRNLTMKMDIPSQHAFVTNDYGNSCGSLGSPWINNCKFDLAGEYFKKFYGNLNSPVNQITSNLLSFNQRTFTNSLGSKGFVYVPKACREKEPCKLHVFFHGCEQYFDNTSIKDIVVKQTGMNKWAESNNIIVLYPQTTSSWSPLNPKGCWDWWGFYGREAYTREGPQMVAVKKMIDRIMNK